MVSGIRFHDKSTNYKGDFSKTEMKEYLDRYNKSYEEKYTAFELAKQDILDKYKPEGMEEYNYFIDFDRAKVEYTEK